jgi:hypothetical protein
MPGKYFLNPPNEDNDNGPNIQKEDTTLGQIQEVDQRRHEVLDYMLLQMEPEEIAEEMGIEESTVKNDIQHITQVGFKGRDEDLEQIRAETVAKFRYTFTKARKEFNRSRQPKEKRAVKYGEGGAPETDEDGEPIGDPNIEEEKVTTEEQIGDSKFLQIMNDSAEKMAKVTGAQKHKEVEINNMQQNNTTNILSPNRSTMPEEFDQFLDKPEGEMTPEERRDAGLDNIEEDDSF